MKKNLMKKVFAVTLSVAMACSIIPATNLVTASAAVKLNTTFKTLKVGQKYKLTLNKNNKNWKVVKATSMDSSVAKVYKTTSKVVKVKGKSEGRTNVKVKLKSGKSTKNLKCKFNVVEKSTPTPTPTPDPGTTTTQTDATVKTQEELDAALDDRNITKITITTEEEAKFTIKDGVYDTVDLIVDAKNSDVENNGVFKSIDILAIKNQTWFENAVGNTLRVAAEIANIVIGENSVVNNITFSAPKAKITLTVNGKVTNATVSAADIVLNIGGTTKEAINVTVAANATGSEVNASAPVNVKASAEMKLNLLKGAENSTLKFEAAVSVAIKNDSETPLDIEKLDGNKDSVAGNGGTKTVSSPAGTTPTPGTSTGNGNNTGNNNTTKTDTPYAEPCVANVVVNTSASIQVTSGSTYVISGGSLRFTISGATQVSGAALECSARVEYGGRTKYLTQKCSGSAENATATFTVSPFSGVESGRDIIISDIQFRVAATSTTNAGKWVPAAATKTWTIGYVGYSGTNVTLVSNNSNVFVRSEQNSQQ